MLKALMILFFFVSSSWAGEMVLLEMEKPKGLSISSSDAKFLVDFESGEVSGVLLLQTDRESCHWTGRDNDHEVCHWYKSVVKTYDVVIPGLMKSGTKLVFEGNSGPVICAELKKGTLFQSAVKIMLTGKCSVTSQWNRTGDTTTIKLSFFAED